MIDDNISSMKIFRDLDEMLSSLGVAPVSEVLSSLSSMNSVASDASGNATPDASLQPISLNNVKYKKHFCLIYNTV